jgi:hypothetical protein
VVWALVFLYNQVKSKKQKVKRRDEVACSLFKL